MTAKKPSKSQQRPTWGKVYPKPLPLKGIGWQRDAMAIFVGVESIPINGYAALPDRTQGKKQGRPFSIVFVRIRKRGNGYARMLRCELLAS